MTIEIAGAYSRCVSSPDWYSFSEQILHYVCQTLVLGACDGACDGAATMNGLVTSPQQDVQLEILCKKVNSAELYVS